MEPRELLNALDVAEKLKDATRHCYTSNGRHESVAEHSWRAALMAYFLADEFPDVDIDRVIKMCLIHDLGEAFTGDIPSFNKTKDDEAREDALLDGWVSSLSKPLSSQLRELYAEMNALTTREARLYKSIDGLEAVIQHNESPLDTWTKNEYALNLTYCEERVGFSDYLVKLRALMRADTEKKIASEKLEIGD